MSHLLTISIGPVQDFIAAARRTADLYAGSQILQELSKHAAKHLAAKGAQLIFPADQRGRRGQQNPGRGKYRPKAACGGNQKSGARQAR
ncbi:MAG: type III-B CRISPR-associated protein Cas10/Cmr2 [Meiothermus sp.]|uniref:type III-B CRISPR-associated protein Cas10/Cmr2 n=1 Tax=Meiothermus sp. TaxID=1955249 RepID=UPI00298F21FA|nr:type III-B CRISPR-associated protein Cas10/Cmr2 [Meiothermus sp.]MDW8481325.1 type III-B CRISPR-associated protein Cas10/Cmr2 [Meiothermus sp.]